MNNQFFNCPKCEKVMNYYNRPIIGTVYICNICNVKFYEEDNELWQNYKLMFYGTFKECSKLFKLKIFL